MIKKRTLALLIVGMVLGVGGTVGYHFTMEYTSTDEFCLSCHNHQIPYDELKTTSHYSNALGITPGCADCHLPHEFLPKLWRKVQASRELYGHLTGVIDTDEKYLEHRDEMKAHEIARLKANDSAECRTCHNVERMDFAAQSGPAREQHQNNSEGKTCIDCHAGIAHTPKKEDEGFDF